MVGKGWRWAAKVRLGHTVERPRQERGACSPLGLFPPCPQGGAKPASGGPAPHLQVS